jgi:hypothetical protein
MLESRLDARVVPNKNKARTTKLRIALKKRIIVAGLQTKSKSKARRYRPRARPTLSI